MRRFSLFGEHRPTYFAGPETPHPEPSPIEQSRGGPTRPVVRQAPDQGQRARRERDERRTDAEDADRKIDREILRLDLQAVVARYPGTILNWGTADQKDVDTFKQEIMAALQKVGVPEQPFKAEMRGGRGLPTNIVLRGSADGSVLLDLALRWDQGQATVTEVVKVQEGGEPRIDRAILFAKLNLDPRVFDARSLEVETKEQTGRRTVTLLDGQTGFPLGRAIIGPDGTTSWEPNTDNIRAVTTLEQTQREAVKKEIYRMLVLNPAEFADRAILVEVERNGDARSVLLRDAGTNAVIATRSEKGTDKKTIGQLDGLAEVRRDAKEQREFRQILETTLPQGLGPVLTRQADRLKNWSRLSGAERKQVQTAINSAIRDLDLKGRVFEMKVGSSVAGRPDSPLNIELTYTWDSTSAMVNLVAEFRGGSVIVPRVTASPNRMP